MLFRSGPGHSGLGRLQTLGVHTKKRKIRGTQEKGICSGTQRHCLPHRERVVNVKVPSLGAPSRMWSIVQLINPILETPSCSKSVEGEAKPHAETAFGFVICLMKVRTLDLITPASSFDVIYSPYILHAVRIAATDQRR